MRREYLSWCSFVEKDFVCSLSENARSERKGEIWSLQEEEIMPGSGQLLLVHVSVKYFCFFVVCTCTAGSS